MDLSETAKRYLRAAEQEVSSAQLALGILYLSRQGVDKNKNTGTGWLTKAAEGGKRLAMANLARCHQKGIGVTRDMNEANKSINKASLTIKSSRDLPYPF